MNENELRALYRYYESTRRVGHTHSMLQGALNTNSIVLAHNQAGAECIRSIVVSSPPIVVTPSDLVNGNLLGCRLPILIDNATICSILRMAINKNSR